MNTPPGFPDPTTPQPPFGGPPQPPTPGSAPTPGFPPTPSFPPTQAVPGQPGWTPQTPVPQSPAPAPQQSSSKAAYILLGVAVVIILGLVAFFVTQVGDDEEASDDAAVSSLSSPEVTVPDLTVPEITVPEITVPQITVPGGSTVVVPTLPSVPTTVAAPTDLLISGQLPEVIAQIATARGAAPLRILSANLYGEYVIVQVQDPTIPANVDQYMWRNGAVGAPEPVTLMGDGDLESNLFSDTEVNWAAIPALVAQALAQIPIEGATVTHINVERNLPFSADIQIRVFVDGTRGSGFLDADAQGNVISVSQG